MILFVAFATGKKEGVERRGIKEMTSNRSFRYSEIYKDHPKGYVKAGRILGNIWYGIRKKCSMITQT